MTGTVRAMRWMPAGAAALAIFVHGAAAAQPSSATLKASTTPTHVPAPGTPQPIERVGFDDALKRAVQRNPSSAIAAAGILRADALLTQAVAATRLQANGFLTNSTLNRGVSFEGLTVIPQNQLAATADVRMPLYAPVQWARRVQARDDRNIAELSVANVNRQTSLAVADAYLTIIATRRMVEANIRARDTARAHYELAVELEQRGAGSRLNMLRAQQELSTVEGLVESAQLAVYRAQEALGVLLVADGPVDAAEEPVFDVPDDAAAAPPGATAGAAAAEGVPGLLLSRPDLKLFDAQRQAAQRVVDDSRKDAHPYFEAIFQPRTTYPRQAFAQQTSAQLLLQLTIPIFDAGTRRGARQERQAALQVSSATLAGARAQASSEVRAARAAVASSDRSLASTRAAADQAKQVVEITNISFRSGAATNIEVIDAERSARDADTAVAVSEDTLRRAKLDLRAALGLFP